MAKGESRLGKGLGALLGEYLEEAEGSVRPERELPVSRIRPNPYQPRTEFDEEGIRELAESIRRNGLLQPLVVRSSGDGWEVVAGERRLRAVHRLGWESVPVVVRELSDEQMLVLALVENLQRADLSPLEEAMGYRQLIEGFGVTQQEVARRVGKDRSTIANTLRLLALPAKVQRMLAEGRLTTGHARALLGLDGAERQIAMAKEVVARGLSVRQTEARVREVRDAPAPGEHALPEPVERRAKDPFARRAERVFERALGTQVRVRVGKGSGGEIRIAFHDAEDFQRLLRLLAGEEARELLSGP